MTTQWFIRVQFLADAGGGSVVDGVLPMAGDHLGGSAV